MNRSLRPLLLLALLLPLQLMAQTSLPAINTSRGQGSSRSRSAQSDSLGSDKVIPVGIRVWTADTRFGDRTPAQVDTVSHMFPNTIFTSGLRGEYNTTGNLGAPRINRIFIDSPAADQFIFTQPYDYVVTPVSQFHFTNTLSPFTNLRYNTAGDRTNGEDHLTAKFGVNAGRKIGVGFLFDYIYGRGYYASQSTSHFNYSMYGSYIGDKYQAHLLFSTLHQKVTENGGITNDYYITHPESFNDNYAASEIPTVLEQNWNRNDNQHIFFSQRYNLGFHRKVRMTDEEIEARKFALESRRENEHQRALDAASEQARRNGQDFDEREFDRQARPTGRPAGARIAEGSLPTDSTQAASGRIAVDGKAMADSLLRAQTTTAEDTAWLKTEYVPVTSFIHTLKFDNYRRIYQAYQSPTSFYADTYDGVGPVSGDSIFDKTSHYRLQNTFALSLLEGFNKWAKAGLKAFITSDLRHFQLPDSLGGTTSYNEHNISIGAQLVKSQGHLLHYNVTAETWLVGKDAGQLKIDARADLNFPLFGDTMTLAANAFFHRVNPTFYYRHYHSRHFWWDNDNGLDKMLHTHVEGLLSYQRTKTRLRFAIDDITNYTYFGMSYTLADDYTRTGNALHVRQASGVINLFTLALEQDVRLGPVHWESVVTYQKSSKADALPVPDLNIYTNLFLRFRIARVLKCDFGADARFFTKYYAPDYSPALGQYAVQESEQRVQTGGYPIVNVYANFHLQRTRFFIMMSHVNAGQGNKAYFFTPHYPENQRILRFGLSWNFFN